MKFTKMQGLGNDYVYVNCFEETVENPGEAAKFVSDRHFGIGADGLILIRPSEAADFRMDMYNADGSRGEMCGNGIRCVAKYVYDKGMTKKTSISVETLAGIKYLDLTVRDGTVETVRVDMGGPRFAPEDIPVEAEGADVIAAPVWIADEADGIPGREYQMTCVSMGNPHCVVFVEDLDDLPMGRLGPLFENHPRFPRRTNTEFVEVLDRQTIRMRVWERGSGETLACGTGACASAVAAVLNGLADERVTVRLLGGDLRIEWDREGKKVYMTGPAEIVFDGEIALP